MRFIYFLMSLDLTVVEKVILYSSTYCQYVDEYNIAFFTMVRSFMEVNGGATLVVNGGSTLKVKNIPQ